MDTTDMFQKLQLLRQLPFEEFVITLKLFHHQSSDSFPRKKLAQNPERDARYCFPVYETTFCTAEQHCVATARSNRCLCRTSVFYPVSQRQGLKCHLYYISEPQMRKEEERMWGARRWWAADSSWEPWQQHSHNSCCSASGRDATESKEDEREKRVWWICKWTPEQSWIILNRFCPQKTAFEIPLADSSDHIWLSIVSVHLRKWSVGLFLWAHTAVLRPKRGNAVGKP